MKYWICVCVCVWGGGVFVACAGRGNGDRFSWEWGVLEWIKISSRCLKWSTIRKPIQFFFRIYAFKIRHKSCRVKILSSRYLKFRKQNMWLLLSFKDSIVRSSQVLLLGDGGLFSQHVWHILPQLLRYYSHDSLVDLFSAPRPLFSHVEQVSVDNFAWKLESSSRSLCGNPFKPKKVNSAISLSARERYIKYAFCVSLMAPLCFRIWLQRTHWTQALDAWSKLAYKYCAANAKNLHLNLLYYLIYCSI